ncbi:MAG: hypothetical protein ABI887_22630 [Burkholderiales bacterium]
MNWSARFSWLAALRSHRAPRTVETDRGDMGTAFGLDASFESPATLPPGHTLPPQTLSALESRLIRRSGL